MNVRKTLKFPKRTNIASHHGPEFRGQIPLRLRESISWQKKPESTLRLIKELIRIDEKWRHRNEIKDFAFAQSEQTLKQQTQFEYLERYLLPVTPVIS